MLLGGERCYRMLHALLPVEKNIAYSDTPSEEFTEIDATVAT